MADATIVLNQTYLGQQIRNVTVWNNFRDPEPDLQELADTIRDIWAAGPSAVFSQAWSLDSVTYVFNDAAPVWSLTVPFTDGVLAGTAGASERVAQTALLVRTSFIGPPPNRGRVYFGGIPVNLVGSTGFWDSAAGASLEAMVTIWANGIATDTNEFFLRIARRDSAGIIIASSPVSNATRLLNPAVQRRRRLNQGQ